MQGTYYLTRNIFKERPSLSTFLYVIIKCKLSIQHRFSRGRSKERGRRSPHNGECDYDSADYAADNSSEHSSSATPHTQSPRHHATTLEGSPLARQDNRKRSDVNSRDEVDYEHNGAPSVEHLHVSIECINFVNCFTRCLTSIE